jgi:adenosylcobinamide amidohydrolase
MARAKMFTISLWALTENQAARTAKSTAMTTAVAHATPIPAMTMLCLGEYVGGGTSGMRIFLGLKKKHHGA